MGLETGTRATDLPQRHDRVMLICWPVGAYAAAHAQRTARLDDDHRGEADRRDYHKTDCNRPENSRWWHDCLAGATRIDRSTSITSWPSPAAAQHGRQDPDHPPHPQPRRMERALREHARLLPPHRLLRGLRHGRAAMLSKGFEVRQRIGSRLKGAEAQRNHASSYSSEPLSVSL